MNTKYRLWTIGKHHVLLEVWTLQSVDVSGERGDLHRLRPRSLALWTQTRLLWSWHTVHALGLAFSPHTRLCRLLWNSPHRHCHHHLHTTKRNADSQGILVLFFLLLQQQLFFLLLHENMSISSYVLVIDRDF